MDDEVLLYAPHPDSVGVQVHLSRGGDLVSEVFICATTGRRVMIMRDVANARRTGEDLQSAADAAYEMR